MYTPKYQEMFDRSIGKLIEQDYRAVEDHHCVMQSRDGSRCAIGWLIPDAIIEDYSHSNIAEVSRLKEFCESWELEPINSTNYTLSSEPEHMPFLRMLMELHDRGLMFDTRKFLSGQVQDWIDRIEKFGVDTTALVAYCERKVDKQTL